MLIDLHAHFPMHVLPDKRAAAYHGLRNWRKALWRARVVSFLSKLFNYEAPGDQPGVTIPLMKQGDVGAILSVLYDGFAEMDLSKKYGAPPDPAYFPDLLGQLESVERSLESEPDAVIARTGRELSDALDANKKVLIHCVEGGFHLGATEQAVQDAVTELARRGVVYITLAHLFWRDIATGAPALPFVPDKLYRIVFPQPSQPLSPLGIAAAERMLDERVFIDITHMSSKAMAATLDLMDRKDPQKRIPVLATHEACRHPRALRRREYNLTDHTIRRIQERGGLIGLIMCPHYILGGWALRMKQTKDFRASVDAVCDHIDHIHEVTDSFENIGIGSDIDGWIKPALKGLGDLGRMADFQAALRARYGSSNAELICSGNAKRILTTKWR